MSWRIERRKRRAAALLAALALVALAPAEVPAAPSDQCEPDALSRNVGRGRVLITRAGAVFETVGEEAAKAALWQAEQRLMLCRRIVERDGKPEEAWILINTDRNEAAGVYRVK